MKEQIRISLAFVGLLVGAGFATGLEVVQYFISFGLTGLWGVLISGLVMTAAGAVFLQLGSYFMAEEHHGVFRKIAHPVISHILDIAVIGTLFCVGFVMLAGAGSNLEQQFGLPAWLGSLIMVILVMLIGLLNVEKVTNVISSLTPLLIIAIVVVFVATLLDWPGDLGSLSELAADESSPVTPWWVSALNYNGLALILGVSMSLVIGGAHTDLRAAGRGGLFGGIIYMLLLAMAAFTLLANIEIIAGDDVPMLSLFESMHPAMALFMSLVIFMMIFSTAIGMFFALGKRVTAGCPQRYVPVFLALCAAGYGVSFIGFDTLMAYVYPVLGYVGLAMVALLVGWRIACRARFRQESDRRERLHDLQEQCEDPAVPENTQTRAELEETLEDSDADSDRLRRVMTDEISVSAVQAGARSPARESD